MKRLDLPNKSKSTKWLSRRTCKPRRINSESKLRSKRSRALLNASCCSRRILERSLSRIGWNWRRSWMILYMMKNTWLKCRKSKKLLREMLKWRNRMKKLWRKRRKHSTNLSLPKSANNKSRASTPRKRPLSKNLCKKTKSSSRTWNSNLNRSWLRRRQRSRSSMKRSCRRPLRTTTRRSRAIWPSKWTRSWVKNLRRKMPRARLCFSRPSRRLFRRLRNSKRRRRCRKSLKFTTKIRRG
jgi:hypothetical protein